MYFEWDYFPGLHPGYRYAHPIDILISLLFMCDYLERQHTNIKVREQRD